MKILTYNVNGIRAAVNKGLFDFLKKENADVVCLQEIKAEKDQADLAAIEGLGYKHFWYSAQKKGYSGVAIFSKTEPKHIEYGCKHDDFDAEGRCIRADFDDFSVLSVYFPSGTTGDIRQEVKYRFLDHFFDYAAELAAQLPGLVVCGDYNICHRAIDIHNPAGNKDSSGFLPEEREWMEKWFNSGFTDGFRHLNPEPDWYTWWSYRANARANNKGWRIDYISVSDHLVPRLAEAKILAEAVHSDHCPMYVTLK